MSASDIQEKDAVEVGVATGSDDHSSFDEVTERYKAEFHYEPQSKWREFFLNVPGHPINEDLFDGEPYNIDTLLHYEDHLIPDRTTFPAWKKVLGFFWDPIFYPPAERKYLLKIDFFIFIYAIFACFIKYLDQTNINNAYVSGMKEDLNMYGSNDYNLLTTYFNIGYLAFSVPLAILMKYVRVSFILPLCEVLWTFLVMIMAVAKDKQTIFILRLLQGIIEASSFPGLCLLIGEYYDKRTLGKRMFMMDATGSIARMFAGYIQAGVYSTMNGRYGIPGWKWVFLVDGFISIPVAFVGFYCLPDFPQNSRAHWMSKKDRQFALARYKASNRVKPSPMTVKVILRTAANWKLWLFVIIYLGVSLGNNSNSYFSLYLKGAGKFTVEQINLIPTGGYGWQFLSMLIFSAASDYTGNRPAWITLNLILGLIGCILLSIWHIPYGLLIFGFMLTYGTLSAQTLFMSWFAETFGDEPDLKAVNVGLGNTFIYAFNAFVVLKIYKNSDGPNYPLGYKISIIYFGMGIILTWVFWHIVRIIKRKKREDAYNEEVANGQRGSTDDTEQVKELKV